MLTEDLHVHYCLMLSVSVHQSQPHISGTASMTSQLIPDNINNLLVKEGSWDFDIIELERVTNKR